MSHQLKAKDKTVVPVLIACLHVMPQGGEPRSYNIYSGGFPFEISRDPKEAWCAEIASQTHPNEGRKVSRVKHLMLVAPYEKEGYFLAENKASGSGCYAGAIKEKADSFKIKFDEEITLGGPYGTDGTVSIKLTRP